MHISFLQLFILTSFSIFLPFLSLFTLPIIPFRLPPSLRLFDFLLLLKAFPITDNLLFFHSSLSLSKFLLARFSVHKYLPTSSYAFMSEDFAAELRLANVVDGRRQHFLVLFDRLSAIIDSWPMQLRNNQAKMKDSNPHASVIFV